MNKILFFFFGLVLSFFGCASDKLELVRNGKSDFSIFVADDAIPAEKNAAVELQRTLEEISDCRIPIVNTLNSSSNVIYVGFRGVPEFLVADINPKEFGKEEYIIRSSEKGVVIAGGEPRGTLYGVVGFLSKHLGCRWYTRDVVKLPTAKTITINSINDRDKPVFEYREAWYKEAYETDWAVHNRLNPTIVPIPDSLGGSYIMKPFVHTFYQLVPPDRYMKSNPEYYSLIDGKRLLDKHKGQLCLTNPDVVKVATETVFRWIEENPNAEIFSVDQNDGYHYCECPECNAINEAEGSQSGTILTFVNKIADSVAEVYPDVKLQTLAYAYSEVPPKTLKPRANVTIRMCHYNYCNAHALGECSDHDQFIERMAGWEKITDRITIWDYYTDFNHYFAPFPNLESVIKNPRYYADHKCIGLFAQGSNVPDNGGGEFSSLRAWVFAQLMWNPYQDGRVLVDEFIENVYGVSSPYIKQYIELLHNEVKPTDIHFTIYDDPTVLDYLKPEILRKSEAIFVQAEVAAKEDTGLLKRVELAHLPVLYAQLYLYSVGGEGYIEKENVEAALIKFQRIIEENNITRLAESADSDISKFIEKVKSATIFITDWWIIGPFDNTDRKGFDKAYPPEASFDTTKTYSGKDGLEVKWEEYDNQRSGYIDFTKLFQPSDDVVSYAYRTIEAAKDTSLKTGVGSNDGVKLWVNGKLVLNKKTSRKAEPNQEELTIPLKKGENTILLKIDQLGGGWGFYFSR
jgi:hypothetical protein